MLENQLILTNPSLPAMTIEQVIERRNLMVEFVKRAMQRDVDYGTIEGTERRDKSGNKIPNDTLYKAGAEKLNTFFSFVPRYLDIRTVEDWTGDEHGGEPLFYYWQKCELYRDGVKVGEGDGSCNSWEKKYRYRSAERVCPQCGKAAIIKGKAEYGGGYLCFQKKGGCGAKFAENAAAILSQQAGQIPNPDIADLPNTLLKMSQKRALVAATLVACNASEFFTQDIEDWIIDAEFKVVSSETATAATRAAAAENNARPALAPTNTHVTIQPLSRVQRAKLIELWRTLQSEPTTEAQALEGLDKIFVASYRHGLADASYEEGARITANILAELRNANQPAPTEQPIMVNAPSEAKPKSARPLTPAQLKDALAKKARANGVNLTAEQIEKRRGLLAGTLQDLCDKNTDKRQELMSALWSDGVHPHVKNLSDLTPAQVGATLDWLTLVHNENAGKWMFKDEQAEKWVRAEIAAVLREALLARGQQELPQAQTAPTPPIQDVTWDELGNASPTPPASIPDMKLGRGVVVPSKQNSAPPPPPKPSAANYAKTVLPISRAQKEQLRAHYLTLQSGDLDAALEAMDQAAHAKYGKSYHELNYAQAEELLKQLDAVPF